MFNIFRFFRPGWDQRFIEHGRVTCPIHVGGTDIERCFACCWLVEVAANSERRFLRCRSESPIDPKQFVA